jgi:hypothetical protein
VQEARDVAWAGHAIRERRAPFEELARRRVARGRGRRRPERGEQGGEARAAQVRPRLLGFLALAGQERGPRDEASDAFAFYSERFRGFFRDAGETVSKVGDQLGDATGKLADWLRGRIG